MSLEPTEQKPKLPWYQDVDGFRIPGLFSAEIYKSALNYKPRSGDLFIVTYPKCGTTWVQNIVNCIFRNGKGFTSGMEFVTQTPFLEMAGAEAVVKMKRPGAIKVHLPFHLVPWSLDAKYIFIARNPKDCCVSFYHHTEKLRGYHFAGGEFDDFFELFINGEVDFGDYFDTLLSWYEHRNDPNVLFITYEQLTKETTEYVMKIAEFMDLKYKETLEKDEKILHDVIFNSSFSSMKEHLNKYLLELNVELLEKSPDVPEGIKALLKNEKAIFTKSASGENDFVRKGIIGDWRNYFSESQNARLEQKFKAKTAGTDIPDLWKDDM